ncbi:hypothetical protein LY76DRAFT_592304 [Colletotrichum caudatum]|nr:hypothetical protein LY76DRAFT_592304 [Colletotrichum caudatum]
MALCTMAAMAFVRVAFALHEGGFDELGRVGERITLDFAFFLFLGRWMDRYLMHTPLYEVFMGIGKMGEEVRLG